MIEHPTCRIVRPVAQYTHALAPVAQASPAVPRQGDQQARLEEMFRQHHALIWRTLCRLGNSADGAADLTQQAYLIAAERLNDIRPGCERAFLFSTAVRLSHTHYRKRKRLELVENMDERHDLSGESKAVPQRDRARQLLDALLKTLDPDLVTVFVLFELEGLTTREIAEAHALPLGTVASRLRRAREAFRAHAARLEGSMKGMGQ